jgi:hypothetical protein
MMSFILIIAAAVVMHSHLKASRAEAKFNEYLVCLLLYELGDAQDSSMPRAILQKILPCHPDESDELIAFLEEQKLIEVYPDDSASRVRLLARPYLLFATGNWRRALDPRDTQQFEVELARARYKLKQEYGAWPV